MVWLGLGAEEYDRQYSDKELMKRVMNYLPPYKKNIAIITLTSVLYSILVGIQPYILTMILEQIQTTGINRTIVLYIGVVILLNLLIWGVRVVNEIQNQTVVSNLVCDLRHEIVESILNQDMAFFDKYPTGKIVSRINADSQYFGDMAILLIRFISNILVIFILVIPVFITNWLLGLIFIGMVPMVAVLVLWFRKGARRRTLLAQRSIANVEAFIRESTEGIQIAKTFNLEEKLYNEFTQVNQQAYRVNVKRALFLNILWPLLEVIQGIIILLLVLGGTYTVQAGFINGTEFYLFLQSMWTLWYPVFQIASFWPQFQVGLASVERIFSLMDVEPSVSQLDKIEAKKLEGTIKIENLRFSYTDEKPVFQNLTLNIEKNESIALVGHTGAGKSSIAKIIMRMYEYQEGQVLVDETDIRKYDLSSLRWRIALIPQTPFLWSETLRYNLNYGSPPVDDKRLWWALEKVSAADWVRGLTDGLDTVIKERGKNISMGQKQLIVFARILLQDPDIIILDEATASVDPFTETKIQLALESLMHDRTSIVIAHRLWTVRHVDRIIVLDHGNIVEQGSHENLMGQNGQYAELYKKYFRHQSYEFIQSFRSLRKRESHGTS